MKKRIRLTESGLRKFVREAITKRLLEDMNMDQYSEFNYDELAQHLAEDLADYGVKDGRPYYNEPKILLELPNEQYIVIEFEFNEDGSLYQVYMDIDETDKNIIRMTGTPYHEVYRLSKGEDFDYNTLLGYVKKLLDIHNNAVESVSNRQNESFTRRVTENVLRKLNESDSDGYAGDSLETFDFNKIAEYLANDVYGTAEDHGDEKEYTTVETELNFRDGSKICAAVSIIIYENITYYDNGDYYTPPSSSGYNTVEIEEEPTVVITNPDGEDWTDEDVEKLNIDWSPLYKLQDEEIGYW